MTRDEARALDAADPLAPARGRFRLTNGIIYLDGNSLGALPAATPALLTEVVERQWGVDLITSWNKHGWIDAPQRIAAKLSPIVGARPSELLIADSTTVSLFKLMAAAVAGQPGRKKLLTEEGNFPTDLYIAQAVADLLGVTLERIPADRLEQAIDDDCALLFLTHVDYRSGRRHDMARLNRLAQSKGALTLWDLSHSAGAMSLDLTATGCDLAVGCGYKYLNGGPGAPAFLFVAEHLQVGLSSPLPGWMGHVRPFDFSPGYEPASGINRFLTGTPSIIALAALEAGLATFDGIDMDEIEAKSHRLSALFIDEVESRCGDEVRRASPRDPAARGSHVVFAHPHGYALIQALIERGVIGDFRAPDLMRFGFAPLYNSHEDVWRAAHMLAEILASGAWDQPRFHARAKVT